MLERSNHYAALPLRIVLGCSFAVLGLQKLAGYFDGPGLARTAELMASGGLTPGTFWAWIVGALGVLGGAAIVLGLLTRWAATGSGTGVARCDHRGLAVDERRVSPGGACRLRRAGPPGAAAVRAGSEVTEARLGVP